MDGVNKTLYIPLYGKAYVSRKGLFLCDPMAERIWAEEGFSLKGKAASKWLAYYMGIRSAVFDRWLAQRLQQNPDAAVIHIGCGLDGRVLRVEALDAAWFDVDFPEVIAERRRFFEETERCHMIAADVRAGEWLRAVSCRDTAIVVMEGVSMYLTNTQLQGLLTALDGHFTRVFLLMDCYTGLAARLSRIKNPVKTVGVDRVWGLDDPSSVQSGGLRFLRERDMTPPELSDALRGWEKRIFRKLYAGSMSRKLYRLFEYRKG